MPIWAFYLSPLYLAVVIVGGVLAVSLLGLWLFRRFVMPKIKVHDGVNDAISGTVQAIGVFYGVTVGLLAVGVWNTWSSSSDLVSREAACISSLYRDLSSFPNPAREALCKDLKAYTHYIIENEWPRQRKGEIAAPDCPTLETLQTDLMAFEPTTQGQQARYAESLGAYNRMLHARSLRLDAVGAGLNDVMWCVIWCGAAISIGVAYYFHLQDFKLHAGLVGLMAGFLGLVIFLIVANDRPFLGEISIKPDSYQLVLDTVMQAR